MKLKVCWIGRTKEAAISALTSEYLKRLTCYVPAEAQELRSEKALLELIARERSRPVVALLDARGRQMTSQEFAEFLRRQQDQGTQTLLFAVGPPDGWSEQTLKAATHTLSLGRMTLAHEIARVVLLEQIYRGFTILAGHPYHTAH
ncbi:MAG: 23S rRNA (pseudouridine(1915)-N(3))-methyltransferase RlmH [Terriglobales bacterium]